MSVRLNIRQTVINALEAYAERKENKRLFKVYKGINPKSFLRDGWDCPS